MPRPRRCRWIWALPNVSYFKPRGIPLSQLDEVILTVDEHEALRLSDVEGLDQEEAAKRMNISRQTFGRVLGSARKKISNAIINAKAIRIEGGDFITADRIFRCYSCGNIWEVPHGTPRPVSCPVCGNPNIHRVEEGRGPGRRGRRWGKGGRFQ
jgi:predicted DNA-binding protein (UPF0251 family)